MKTLVLLTSLWLVSIVAVSGTVHAATEGDHPVIPVCQEDAVLVGEGDFNAGRWTSYVCGHAVDDYVGIGQPDISGVPVWAAESPTGPVWVCDPAEAGDYDLDNLTELDIKELRNVALDPTNDYAEVCR